MTERERLIEILSVPIHPRIGADYAEVVADYLLDNGVIVPPCKIGDIVYDTNFGLTHGQGAVITEGKVTRFDVAANSLLIIVKTTEPIKTYGIYSKSFGKTTFLTREEAEVALKEREKNG